MGDANIRRGTDVIPVTRPGVRAAAPAAADPRRAHAVSLLFSGADRPQTPVYVRW